MKLDSIGIYTFTLENRSLRKSSIFDVCKNFVFATVKIRRIFTCPKILRILRDFRRLQNLWFCGCENLSKFVEFWGMRKISFFAVAKLSNPKDLEHKNRRFLLALENHRFSGPRKLCFLRLEKCHAFSKILRILSEKT